MLALAVLSTAFTSQAIATGFERRYGVLKRLGSTPLSRGGLIGAKTVTVLGVELAQAVILLGVGLALGWQPNTAGPAAAIWVVLLVLAGTAAFSGLGLLLAGTLRAEATLALANLIYLVLLGIGGIIFPLTKYPAHGAAGAHPAALRGALRRAAQGAAVRIRVPAARPGGAGRLGGRPDHAGHAAVPLGVADRHPAPELASAQRPEAGALWTAIPPSLLIVTGIFSVQFGAGLAAKLFAQVPPAAVTGLRLWTSAVVMVLIGARPLRKALSGLARRRAWRDAAVAVGFGVTLAVMNFSIYQSFARIPLGIAVTVEFLGPLGVAVASSRRLLDVLWVGLAGTGVALLARGHLDASGAGSAGHGAASSGQAAAGLAFALLAGLAWAAYILLSRATGQRFPGSTGLAIAMVVAAIVITPVGVAAGRAALLRPGVAGDRAGDRAALVDHPVLAGA